MERIETEYGHKEIGPYGTTWYYNNKNKLHNPNGPAVEGTDGLKAYWINGVRHRTDGPAVLNSDGTKEYYLNGKLHRTDGPAIEYPGGAKAFCVNGLMHNTKGPAVIKDNAELHFIKGKYVWKE